MSQGGSPKSQKSVKSDKSAGSAGSGSSTWSIDSFQEHVNLTEACEKVLQDEGLLRLRKKVSHDSKKVNPAALPAKNIKFGTNSPLEQGHDLYKAEVEKVNALKKAYKETQTNARRKLDVAPHEACIQAAKAWAEQSVAYVSSPLPSSKSTHQIFAMPYDQASWPVKVSPTAKPR